MSLPLGFFSFHLPDIRFSPIKVLEFHEKMSTLSKEKQNTKVMINVREYFLSSAVRKYNFKSTDTQDLSKLWKIIFLENCLKNKFIHSSNIQNNLSSE